VGELACLQPPAETEVTVGSSNPALKHFLMVWDIFI
jgi:hypothetical protein